jgi:hypothetical protein
MLEIVALVDLANDFLGKYYVATIAAVIAISLGLILRLGAKRIYSPRGRVLADLFWVLSSTATIAFTIAGLRFDPILANANENASALNPIRESLGHETAFLRQKWCVNWHDDSNLATAPRSEICSLLVYVGDESIRIGLMFMQNGWKWEDIPRYDLNRTDNTPFVTTAGDGTLLAEYSRIIPSSAKNFNGFAASLAASAWEIRLAVAVKLLRMIAIHLSASAAVFRVGRSIHELAGLSKIDGSPKITANTQNGSA